MIRIIFYFLPLASPVTQHHLIFTLNEADQRSATRQTEVQFCLNLQEEAGGDLLSEETSDKERTKIENKDKNKTKNKGIHVYCKLLLCDVIQKTFWAPAHLCVSKQTSRGTLQGFTVRPQFASYCKYFL